MVSIWYSISKVPIEIPRVRGIVCLLGIEIEKVKLSDIYKSLVYEQVMNLR